MQIDFHHAVTYVVARLAGFPHEDAATVAHAAQYVDDATQAGEIWFQNGMVFPRIASAHKMLDYANTNQLANHRVWLPFHFFPGNKGEGRPEHAPQPYGQDEFLRRCICIPNSAPARDLIRMAIERQDRPYGLHQLGVAAHVFVDTWAHQGFVGYQHRVNAASDIQANDTHHPETLVDKLKRYFHVVEDEKLGDLIGLTFPLGHGAVLSYPDLPYLEWSYTNGEGLRIQRHNPRDFLAAAKELYQWLVRYLRFPDDKAKVFSATVPTPAVFEAIGECLASIKNPDGQARHGEWMDLIRTGKFGFSEPNVSYIEKGPGSWKAEALGTEDDVADTRRDPIPLPPGFANSHWKHFHDALLAHRFFVLYELLPAYGLLSG
jgi:hypothetical protein